MAKKPSKAPAKKKGGTGKAVPSKSASSVVKEATKAIAEKAFAKAKANAKAKVSKSGTAQKLVSAIKNAMGSKAAPKTGGSNKSGPTKGPKPKQPAAAKTVAVTEKTFTEKTVAQKPVAQKPVAATAVGGKLAGDKSVTGKAEPGLPAAAKPAVATPVKPAIKPAPINAPDSLHKPSRPVNESPPVDHNASLMPLFLGATHGYLSRSVDAAWSEALAKYRQALEAAIGYEETRSPESRMAMALFVQQKVTGLLTQLAARLGAILRERDTVGIDPAQAAALMAQAARLTQEMKSVVALWQEAFSKKRLLKDIAAPGTATTSLLSWIARVADFERTLTDRATPPH